jgi:hypothetical protein
LSFEPFEHEESMDSECPQGKRSDESDHVRCIQNHARQERPTMSGARSESQPYEGYQPRADHAVHREGISFQKPPAIKAQQIKCADADEKVDPHWKQPAGERSQTRSPEEIVRGVATLGE